eukprot:jgi/Galph1/5885/GphlegSOOS_G4431.1
MHHHSRESPLPQQEDIIFLYYGGFKRKKKESTRKSAATLGSHTPAEPDVYLQGLEKLSKYILLQPQNVKINLSLWESVEISSLENATASDAEIDSSKLHLCYTGGEVWAIDTLYRDDKIYLALSAYQQQSKLHRLRERYHRRGLIQFWEYDMKTQIIGCIFCITHEGDFCRHLRWFPTSGREYKDSGTLGLLLACLGDGSLQIFRVLDHASHQQKSKGEPLIVQNDSLFNFPKDDSSGVITTAEWSVDGSWVIAGDTTGTIHLWKINLTEEASSKMTSYHQSFPGHQVAIRCLATPFNDMEVCCLRHPAEMTLPTKDLFASASMDGCIRVWNIGFLHLPLLEFRLGQSWIYELRWLSTKELIAALDDGSIRFLSIEEANKASKMWALFQGSCWCLSVASSLVSSKHVFSISAGGENGEWIYISNVLSSNREKTKSSWNLATVKQMLNESSSCTQPQEKEYCLITFVNSSTQNIPAVASYLPRPTPTGSYMPYAPDVAFHQVFHQFVSPKNTMADQSVALGATFGDGWLLIGTLSSLLVNQL